MHTPKISVIVPVYNVQNYLRQCLDSIIGQSFSNFEMICINDGSTDDSPQILEQYAALDSRIRIISQPNRGLSAARNAGLAQATAEYIFFIDSDDYIEPDTLEKLFDTARRTGADLTCADFLPFPETEADKKETKNKQAYFDQTEKTPQGCRPLADNPLKIHVVVNGKLHKNSIIKQFNLSFPEQRLIHEDEYWAWAYGIHCQSYFYLPDKLYNYRIHSHSITGTERNSPRPLDIIDINVLITRELQRFNRLPQHLPQLENVFNQNLTAALLKSGADHYKEARQKMKSYFTIPGISEQFRENISNLTEAEIPLSVIVPVHNNVSWLHDCLDSLLAQTADIFEIICIRDDSTDDNLQVLQQYAARSPRIRIAEQNGDGLSAARNTGLDLARGKYVMFVDSNDWTEPRTVEKVFLYMQRHRLDVLAFRQRLYNPAAASFDTPDDNFPTELPFFSIHNGNEAPAFLTSLPVEICNKAYRRRFLEQQQLAFDQQLKQGEDELFHLQSLPASNRCGILKEQLYNHRRPPVIPAISNRLPQTIGNVFGLLDGIWNLYQKQNNQELKTVLAARYLKHVAALFQNYPVFKNRFCYNSLRHQLKKQKKIFRNHIQLDPKTYENMKQVVNCGYLRHFLKQLLNSFNHSRSGRLLLNGGHFVKSYFLFPWYIYQIYKMMRSRKP